MKDKIIISASRRTDIPAFYSTWFMDRIKAGFCTYPNPLFPTKSYRVELSLEHVAGLVFWTRNPIPLQPHLKQLNSLGYGYYFMITLNNYPRTLETNRPDTETSIHAFKELSNQIDPKRVIWRYDPIILSESLNLAWHQKNFTSLLQSLHGYTEKVIISIIDPYRKTLRHTNLPEIGTITYDIQAYNDLLNWLQAACHSYKLAVQCCAEPNLDTAGIQHGPCVDANLLSAITGEKISHRKHRHREGCCCHQSVDIGINNSCAFGCRYCYATSDHTKASLKLKSHNPMAESL